MLRGHWSVILAALGWLILAASPPQQQRTDEQRHSEQAIANSLERIAGALDRNNEPANYSAECRTDAERRDSDLCAQWKAADAASESAGWARWSWFLGLVSAFIGFLTLGAAAAAAYFAKKAADHTGTGATAARDALAIAERNADAATAQVEVARDTAQHQLRAYLYPGSAILRLKPQKASMKAGVDIALKNTGQTPAKLIYYNCEVKYHSAATYVRISGDGETKWRDLLFVKTNIQKVAGPNNEIGLSFAAGIPLKDLMSPAEIVVKLEWIYCDYLGRKWEEVAEFTTDQFDWPLHARQMKLRQHKASSRGAT